MRVSKAFVPWLALAAFACGADDSSSPLGAGSPDAGTPPSDASSPGLDATTTGVDSAVPPTGDAGTKTDAATGTDAAAGTCADPSLVFCDDFEGYAAGPAKSTKWKAVTATANDTLTIDATHARGTKALHVHVTQNEFGYAKLTTFAPPAAGFFGRLYVWATAFPTAPDYAHFTMVETAGQPSTAGVIRPIGGQYDPVGKSADWGVGSDQGPTGDWTNWRTSAPAQGGKWLCMEWEMRTADNVINVWIDGVAKTDLTVSTKVHGGNNVDFVFPKWDSLWFGWWLYQASPTPNQFDLWYDDVAIGTARLGCP
jgi:hypothetical protein